MEGWKIGFVKWRPGLTGLTGLEQDKREGWIGFRQMVTRIDRI